MSLKIVEQKSTEKLTQMMFSPIDVTKCLEVAACVVIGGPPHTTTEAFVIGSYLNRLQNLTHPDFLSIFQKISSENATFQVLWPVSAGKGGV